MSEILGRSEPPGRIDIQIRQEDMRSRRKILGCVTTRATAEAMYPSLEAQKREVKEDWRKFRT